MVNPLRESDEKARPHFSGQQIRLHFEGIMHAFNFVPETWKDSVAVWAQPHSRQDKIFRRKSTVSKGYLVSIYAMVTVLAVDKTNMDTNMGETSFCRQSLYEVLQMKCLDGTSRFKTDSAVKHRPWRRITSAIESTRRYMRPFRFLACYVPLSKAIPPCWSASAVREQVKEVSARGSFPELHTCPYRWR